MRKPAFIFTEGYNAGESGKSSVDCPYPKGSEQSVEWHSGYDYAVDYGTKHKPCLLKWEYTQHSHCSISYMNELGNDGWELVSHSEGIYTFKRSKPQ